MISPVKKTQKTSKGIKKETIPENLCQKREENKQRVACGIQERKEGRKQKGGRRERRYRTHSRQKTREREKSTQSTRRNSPPPPPPDPPEPSPHLNTPITEMVFWSRTGSGPKQLTGVATGGRNWHPLSPLEPHIKHASAQGAIKAQTEWGEKGPGVSSSTQHPPISEGAQMEGRRRGERKSNNCPRKERGTGRILKFSFLIIGTGDSWQVPENKVGGWVSGWVW